MPNFEEMGRTLDRELERLREVAESKVKPATCEKAAGVLRSVSASLSWTEVHSQVRMTAPLRG